MRGENCYYRCLLRPPPALPSAPKHFPPVLAGPLVRSLRPSRVPSSQVAHGAAASPASGFLHANGVLRFCSFAPSNVGGRTSPFAALPSETRQPRPASSRPASMVFACKNGSSIKIKLPDGQRYLSHVVGQLSNWICCVLNSFSNWRLLDAQLDQPLQEVFFSPSGNINFVSVFQGDDPSVLFEELLYKSQVDDVRFMHTEETVFVQH